MASILTPRHALAALAVLLWPVSIASAQDPPKPEPDTLIFINGEKLIGEFLRSDNKSVTFKSEMAGEVTVDWTKVQELRSQKQFAVVPEGVKLDGREEPSQIKRGTIAVRNQELEITSGPTTKETIGVKQAGHMITESSFQRAFQRLGSFFDGWKGAISAGASLVAATQESRTIATNVSLTRTVPEETWMESRHRTILNFKAAYGTLKQPELPRLKTRILHLDLERDRYFSSKFYVFAQAAFDHNFSQGLDSQQNYGSGIGWTAIKTEKTTFDLKGSLSYVKQNFQDSADNQNLFASTFGQSFQHTFGRGIVIKERITASPAWTNLAAYSANGSASISMPVYRRLTFTIEAVDTFLNGPPTGFQKNSFQLTTGLTYTLQ